MCRWRPRNSVVGNFWERTSQFVESDPAVPLPKEELVDVVTGINWTEVGFGLNSVHIQGKEHKVVRLQWLPRIEPGGEFQADE